MKVKKCVALTMFAEDPNFVVSSVSSSSGV